MKDFFSSPDVRQDRNARTLSFFCTTNTILINNGIINQLVEESRKNNNCDVRISLHKSPDDDFHNMIILQNKGNYYRPHKHEKKVEAYHLIKGEMAVFIFNDDGSVKESDILDSEENFIYRIPSNTWHVSIPITNYVVFNESKPGPFLGKGDSIFATWAPDGSEIKKGQDYFSMLLEKINNKKNMEKINEIGYLIKKAKQIRKESFDLALKINCGHIAPSLSIIEILVALYEKFLTKEDKFILSKGHGCLGFYAMLRHKGFNPTASIHPEIEREQGIECTTGSLGHGLPIGLGMAFAKKFKNERGNIFVLLGDGECQEGTTWESLNLAKRFKLDNLTIIIDHNKLQALSSVNDIMNEDNLRKKFEAFGCNVIEIDGHDFNEIINSLSPENNKNGIPKVIIAHTIKGKGISFMENAACWHSKIPEEELIKQAYKELE